MNAGDTVYALCSVQVAKKSKGGKRSFAEDYESGDAVLGEGQLSPSPPARGLWDVRAL